jgi:hypothetical protein
MKRKQNQDDRSIILAATGLQHLSEEFADEIGRSPSCDELFDILTQSLRSEYFNELLDTHNPVLKPLVKIDDRRFDTEMHTDKIESSVADLNDNVFVYAAEFVLGDLIKAIKADTGQPPTLKHLCHILVEGLHRCNDHLLADTNPLDISGIKFEVRKGPKIICHRGDCVALPAKNGEYFLAMVLAKNRFGVAFGFFAGTSKSRRIDPTSLPPVRRYPFYSGTEYITNGRWEINDHNEALLAFFPREPEIYHRSQIISVRGIPEIGPYGSGETASGELRHLTKEEAAEIGLLCDKYRQIHLPEQLETYLNNELD